MILDGGKGLRAAVRKAFHDRALVHRRAEWHKRDDLAKREGLIGDSASSDGTAATYTEALIVRSRRSTAAGGPEPIRGGSLAEGLDETLTLSVARRLYGVLGRSLKTTNCLESINALSRNAVRRSITQNSSQRHRWLATALLDIEPRLRKVGLPTCPRSGPR